MVMEINPRTIASGVAIRRGSGVSQYSTKIPQCVAAGVEIESLDRKESLTKFGFARQNCCNMFGLVKGLRGSDRILQQVNV